jgi:hypothetical protein
MLNNGNGLKIIGKQTLQVSESEEYGIKVDGGLTGRVTMR